MSPPKGPTKANESKKPTEPLKSDPKIATTAP